MLSRSLSKFASSCFRALGENCPSQVLVDLIRADIGFESSESTKSLELILGFVRKCMILRNFDFSYISSFFVWCRFETVQ